MTGAALVNYIWLSMDRVLFARALRDSLAKFIEDHEDTKYRVAKAIGVDTRRLYSYFKESPQTGRPRIPSAEVLYLLCTELGFSFDYRGFRISAETLDGVKAVHPTERQLSFEFDREFYLTNTQGAVTVSIKRPAGKIQLSVVLNADTA